MLLSGPAVIAAGDLAVHDFALQQLEYAAQEIAAVKRGGDEFVANAVVLRPMPAQRDGIARRAADDSGFK